jgi:hypothetical protein
MRADNTIHLTTAARHRHELTRSKTIRALRELDASGGAVTFEVVAKSAGVSRSWLYTQPDIRAEIERLRSLHHLAPAQAVPDNAPPTRHCYNASRSPPHATMNSPKTTSDSDDNSPKPSASYEQPE